MCTLYENLLSLCAEKGITGGKMCTDIGISKSLMTGLKKGRRSGISTETAQKIADYFGVSVDRVLGKESQTYSVGGPASFRSGLIPDAVVIPEQKEKSPAPEGAELSPIKQEAWNLIQKMDEDTLRKFIATASIFVNKDES